MSAFNRPQAICWSCGAAERHRALWLYLRDAKPFAQAKDVLHFSAEYPLAVRLRDQIGPGYKTSEYEPGKAELQIDITKIDLPDESLDGIICSHVLEHVRDDALAMREVHRVLRPGGTAIVMVPLDHSRTTTYEDPEITEPDDREAAFWQHDHVRLYAPDIATRLETAGFDVTSTSPAKTAGPDNERRFALRQDDVVFTCARPGSSSSGS
jgi:SAM-dependent methyltransferase